MFLLLIDWILVALLIVISKVFDLLYKPHQWPFSVNDMNIAYPMTKNETVNNTWLWVIFILIFDEIYV